ncbi:hypothetical protein DSM104443_02410 [Usitatibacter rugosus]|uniref:DUF1161 domain-containing protein n=1 Tax=Usitatibacter rugosus TaxID=2732067 RepID=A0A6M4GWG3_9PROT|nr:DUF1161 domain-containing protein [Usitatibacter rugosus]QJR11335.1 hypothetical protein DSM104443_02410 [Usitatibacter rugosus]
MKTTIVTLSLALAAGPVFATPCDEVKAKIAEKVEKKGVKDYTIEAVAPDAVGDKRVVGTCEGGKKKLVYTREAAKK